MTPLEVGVTRRTDPSDVTERPLVYNKDDYGTEISTYIKLRSGLGSG